MEDEETTPSTGSCDCTNVCSLSPEELRERLAMIRREILPHVRRTQELANGRAWEFHASSAMQAKLEHLVELERKCCSGLEWSLQRLRDSDALRLCVKGFDPRSDLFESVGGRER